MNRFPSGVWGEKKNRLTGRAERGMGAIFVFDLYSTWKPVHRLGREVKSNTVDCNKYLLQDTRPGSGFKPLHSSTLTIN